MDVTMFSFFIKWNIRIDRILYSVGLGEVREDKSDE